MIEEKLILVRNGELNRDCFCGLAGDRLIDRLGPWSAHHVGCVWAKDRHVLTGAH
mgnify:CR=1 FL=1